MSVYKECRFFALPLEVREQIYEEALDDAHVNFVFRDRSLLYKLRDDEQNLDAFGRARRRNSLDSKYGPESSNDYLRKGRACVLRTEMPPVPFWALVSRRFHEDVCRVHSRVTGAIKQELEAVIDGNSEWSQRFKPDMKAHPEALEIISRGRIIFDGIPYDTFLTISNLPKPVLNAATSLFIGRNGFNRGIASGVWHDQHQFPFPGRRTRFSKILLASFPNLKRLTMYFEPRGEEYPYWAPIDAMVMLRLGRIETLELAMDTPGPEEFERWADLVEEPTIPDWVDENPELTDPQLKELEIAQQKRISHLREEFEVESLGSAERQRRGMFTTSVKVRKGIAWRAEDVPQERTVYRIQRRETIT